MTTEQTNNERSREAACSACGIHHSTFQGESNRIFAELAKKTEKERIKEFRDSLVWKSKKPNK